MTDQGVSTHRSKAEQTRAHILETALLLFRKEGYDATTMRDIAAAAKCSLGLTYRYFSRKEDLVFALYVGMAAETNAEIEGLPSATIAERFYKTMVARLESAVPYRDSIGALFGAMMNPASGVSLLGDGTVELRQQTYQAFMTLISEARDAPASRDAEALATLLYSGHFALILFWLFDPSPNQRITAELLVFVRDMLGLGRRVIRLPFVSSGMMRLATIISPVFRGE